MPHDSKLKSRSDDRFKILFEVANDALFIIDQPEGVVESANRGAQEIMGLSQNQIVGKSIEDLGIEKGVLDKEGFHEGVRLIVPDGSTRYVDVGVRKIIHKHHRWVFLFIRDTTEKRLLERELITKHAALKSAYIELERKTAELESMQESLVQAGKLSALGRLAAGVAHELNQPLTAISGFAEELKHELDECGFEDKNGFLKDIIHSSTRMSKIIQQLRVFGRKGQEGYTNVNLEELLDGVLSLLRAQLNSHGISLETKVEKDIPKVYCDPFQLEQVLINLVSNAKDAIIQSKNHHGKILIDISLGKKPEDFGRVLISVCDNGIGIPEDFAKNIFDPFFTTKEVGKGMGLGLSICYGILEKVNGTIVAAPREEGGTKFQVNMPIDFRENENQTKEAA
jgi:PAS domain S-box-containing protein